MPGNRSALPWLIIAAFVLGSALFSVNAQTSVAAPAKSGSDFHDQVEQQTFFLVNQYRQSHDMPALVWSDDIAKVARAHSKDMATGDVDFGHGGFGDRVSELRSVMPGFRGAGENVLMTSDLNDVAKSAVTNWLHSPHHLENIRGDYNYSGLGVWQDKNGVIYFTQIFMKFALAAAETESTPKPELINPFGMLAAPNTRARP